MSGSETKAMTRNEVLAAVRALPPSKDFVWNGVDEEDRPATVEELQASVAFTRSQKAANNGSMSADSLDRLDSRVES
ncbi:MAG TPA: hypothetical protein VIK56_09310 [Rhodoferax sp.]